MQALELRYGRNTKDDTIESIARIIFNYKIGDSIKKGDVIAQIFSDNKNKLNDVQENFRNALTFSRQS